MKSPPQTLSPIRIYVLWHPGFDNRDAFTGRDPQTLDESEKARFDRGLKLARRIYHWFRMENMEGIPVYFRSTAAEGGSGIPLPISREAGVRNYIIPLVDANMVSCPEWRRYAADFATRDDDTSTLRRGSCEKGQPEFRVLPVAVESVAYNMPESMRRLNFIRHIPREDKLPDDMELLAKLTEVLCRDLRFWLQRDAAGKLLAGSATVVPRRIKIFLSHAKADDTDEAVAIKEYIQRETQCEAFFDETDIASAHDYTQILQGALTGESAGLVVIQGDNYADRPWCRKEIRDFLNPTPDPLALDNGSIQFFIPPVVVVQTMKGKQIGRTIPELGYSPCVRWQGDSARFVITTLLREILFGLFYRILADRIAQRDQEADSATSNGSRNCVYINRAPDPVMVNRILKQIDTQAAITEIVHPGYGLSKMEKEGLESSVRGIGFSSFLGRATPSPPNGRSLAGKIIAVSAGNPGDALSRGIGDEHIQELLVRLLRPLLSSQASLLYGGVMPDSIRPAAPWNARVNFTGALLQLLLTERETKNPEFAGFAPRLYVPKPWHERHTITVQDVAQWTDICSFISISAEDSGIHPDMLPAKPQPLTEDDFDGLTDREKHELKREHQHKCEQYAAVELALRARSLSAMRRKICSPDQPLRCQLPDAPGDTLEVRPLAHILIGGKTQSFTGIMPGVFEEALCAFEAGHPVFIIAEGGGAAALLAEWLVTFPKPDAPPPEFTLAHYRTDKTYAAFLSGLKDEAFSNSPNSPPADALADLWKWISKAKSPRSLAGLLKNGLTAEENESLLKSTTALDTCQMVWRGIKNLAAKAGGV
ncbi:TIR domain-containing protein [bacterium]|nr:TIR domain-containing protein [bacterium]